MTLEELKALPKTMLIPTDIAQFLQVNPHWIRLVARDNPKLLPFPVLVVNNRTKIPKAAFIEWYEHGGIMTWQD